jgi:hypothetical protein
VIALPRPGPADEADQHRLTIAECDTLPPLEQVVATPGMEVQSVKTIGVLGGMSGVASGEYYRLLNERVNARLGGHAAAEVLLYSVDFAVIERCIRSRRGRRPRPTWSMCPPA